MIKVLIFVFFILLIALRLFWDWLSEKKVNKAFSTVGSIATILAVFAAIWIGVTQNRINQAILDLNLQPLVAIDYNDSVKTIDVHNIGEYSNIINDVRFHGKSIFNEQQPILITPGGMQSFPISGDIIDGMINSEDYDASIEVSIENELKKQKYIIPSILHIERRLENGNINHSIRVQTFPMIRNHE